MINHEDHDSKHYKGHSSKTTHKNYPSEYVPQGGPTASQIPSQRKADHAPGIPGLVRGASPDISAPDNDPQSMEARELQSEWE